MNNGAELTTPPGPRYNCYSVTGAVAFMYVNLGPIGNGQILSYPLGLRSPWLRIRRQQSWDLKPGLSAQSLPAFPFWTASFQV